MPMVCCQIKGYGVLWNLYLLCVRKGFKPNSNKRAIKLEPSPTNNHVLERPTNCDARGSILCATRLWRHSKWRWKDERPADRTKKHGSAFACVHRTPTRSQVAQEIRKRSSFVERNKLDEEKKFKSYTIDNEMSLTTFSVILAYHQKQ